MVHLKARRAKRELIKQERKDEVRGRDDSYLCCLWPFKYGFRICPKFIPIEMLCEIYVQTFWGLYLVSGELTSF